MSARGTLTTVKRRVLGLALLMTIVMFVVTCLAFYQKAFSNNIEVKLQAAFTGNQIRPESDVKIRGMVVGRVEHVEATRDGSVLDLSIQPEMAEKLPSNVKAQFLPRTLFGERYVSLDMPKEASSESLTAGTMIQQDTSQSAVALEKVLADTMPVLQAVHPQDLATTLNALDQALSGRGEQLGDTLSRLNTYLEGLNPSVPDLKQNLQELVGVAQTYETAAPDVINALDNFSTTARTLVDQQQNLQTLTGQLTTTSNDLTGFLEKNGDNIVTLADTSKPTLDLLARYSPSFPCFLNDMAKFVPRVRKAFGEGTDEPGLHITLEVTAHRGKYVPNQDEPEFNDSRGPRCYDFMENIDPMPEYPPDGPFKDGSVPPPASRPATGGLNPPAETAPSSTSSQWVNSKAEQDMVATVLAPAVGRSAEEVPDWGTLLVGPVLRGAEVSYR